MMKSIVCLILCLSSSVCYATGQWIPVNQQQLVVQEQVIPELVFPDNAIVQPAVPQPQVLPPKPLVKKIKWVLTPNVTFAEAPYYTRGLFGGLIVKKQIVLYTTWVWTPVEVWEWFYSRDERLILWRMLF